MNWHSYDQKAHLELLGRVLDTYGKQCEVPLEQAVKEDTIDRAKWSFLYELAVAIEEDLIIWQYVPPRAFDALSIMVPRMAHSRTRQDNGVDVASVDLKTCVQAKWYSKTKYVKWEDASTFHSLSSVCKATQLIIVSPPGIKLCLLAQNLPITHKFLSDERFLEICAAARAGVSELTVDRCEAPIAGISSLLDELLGEPVVETTTLKATLETTAPDLPLRFCQQQAIELVEQTFESHDTAAVAMACGSGKSRVIAEVIRRSHSGNQHLIFVPSKLLLYQMAETFAQFAPELKVGLIGDGHTFEECTGADAVVCIYNSVAQTLDHQWGMVIVDEAHHVFQEFADLDLEETREFAELIRSVPYEQTLLMSATIPDDPDFPLAYSYSIEEAISDGILCDYHIVIPVVSEGGSPREAVTRLFESHPEWRRILAYCNSLKAAAEFAEQLNARGISADWFGGETPMAQRIAKIEAFRAGALRVLVTVHTLGEGVDIAEADTCAFIEPRNSPIDVTQCVGRILRTSPGKTVANVITPSSSEERELVRFMEVLGQSDSRLRFDQAGRNRISVVREADDMPEEEADLICEAVYSRTGALISGGEWMVWFELLKQYVEENGDMPMSTTIYKEKKLGSWLSDMRKAKKQGRLAQTRIELLESVPNFWWEKDLDGLWMEKYDLLLQYVNELGKIPSSKSGEYHGIKLGLWVQNLRTAKKGDNKNRYNLTKERIELLEAVPGWMWEMRDELWDRKFELLKEYVEAHGSIPSTRAKYKSVTIGSWILVNRTNHSDGKLEEDKVKLLESIPGWTWSVSYENTWETSFDLLSEFVSINERLPLTNESYEGIKLGQWCGKNRTKFKAGLLSEERVRSLESIQIWKWDVISDPWMETYLVLQEFVALNSQMPGRKLYKGMRLDIWAQRRRTQYRSGELTETQIDLLEAIDGWMWNPLEETWMKNFNALVDYVNINGDLPTNQTVHMGLRIGGWIIKERTRKRNGKLPEDKVVVLESIPGWLWDVDKENWLANYRLLEEFVQERGDIPSSTTIYKGKKIGSWLSDMRKKKKKGTLTEEYIEKLEAIPGWWWSKK